MLYTLGEAALRTAFLAGVLQSTLSLLRVRRARLLLVAWTIVLPISLAMPFFLRSSPLPVPLDDSVPRALIDGASDLMQQPLMAAPTEISSLETQTLPSVEVGLTCLYVVIACGFGLRLLLGVSLSLRILARAATTRPDWAAGARVRLSRDVTGPVTIARTIVLPTDCLDWPAPIRQAVMAHEQAHVSQLDYAMLVIAQLNRAVFWFSPLSWWLYHRLAILTELVSDDRAIEATRDRVGYAEILLDMAQRSGPAMRGPSMARFSTLPARIDRILLDRMTSNKVAPLQWATLTFGVAAASMLVANVAPSIVLSPMAPAPTSVDPPDVEAPNRRASTTELPPPAKMLEPSETHAPITREIVSPIARAQPARVAARLRPTPGAPAKTALPPPVIKTERIATLARAVTSRAAPPAPEIVDQPKARVEPQGSPATAAPTANAVVHQNEILYPRISVNDPLRANVDRLEGSTCVGTIMVGSKAYSSGGFLDPRVTAGQIVPAEARFFRKADGSSWVRFGSFDRPPLDVRVQPTRTGVTWTGEYGITYAVQDAGNGRFVGLAARIANDSAPLNFTCRK